MMTEYLSVVICWLVGFVLFSAAWGKLEGLAQFKSNLVDSFHLSKRFSSVLAPALVVVESVLGIFIISDSMYTEAAMIMALMIFVTFTSFLLYHWLQDARVKCSCFGEDDRPVSAFDLLRNALIILLIAIYLLLGQSTQIIMFESQLLLAGLGLVLSIVVIHLHDIIMLFMSARGKL